MTKHQNNNGAPADNPVPSVGKQTHSGGYSSKREKKAENCLDLSKKQLREIQHWADTQSVEVGAVVARLIAVIEKVEEPLRVKNSREFSDSWARIESRMAELGMSKHDLAHRMGTTEQNVYSAMKARRKLNRRSIKKYAAALDVTPEYIQGLTDDHNGGGK